MKRQLQTGVVRGYSDCHPLQVIIAVKRSVRTAHAVILKTSR